MLTRLLFRSDDVTLSDLRTLLFEFGDSPKHNQLTELLIANVLFLLLLFEAHAYLVSSGAQEGEFLGVQDGYIYFIARHTQKLESAQTLINQFEQNPRISPSWLTDL